MGKAKKAVEEQSLEELAAQSVKDAEARLASAIDAEDSYFESGKGDGPALADTVRRCRAEVSELRKEAGLPPLGEMAADWKFASGGEDPEGDLRSPEGLGQETGPIGAGDTDGHGQALTGTDGPEGDASLVELAQLAAVDAFEAKVAAEGSGDAGAVEIAQLALNDALMDCQRLGGIEGLKAMVASARVISPGGGDGDGDGDLRSPDGQGSVDAVDVLVETVNVWSLLDVPVARVLGDIERRQDVGAARKIVLTISIEPGGCPDGGRGLTVKSGCSYHLPEQKGKSDGESADLVLTPGGRIRRASEAPTEIEAWAAENGGDIPLDPPSGGDPDGEGDTDGHGPARTDTDGEKSPQPPLSKGEEEGGGDVSCVATPEGFPEELKALWDWNESETPRWMALADLRRAHEAAEPVRGDESDVAFGVQLDEALLEAEAVLDLLYFYHEEPEEGFWVLKAVQDAIDTVKRERSTDAASGLSHALRALDLAVGFEDLPGYGLINWALGGDLWENLPHSPPSREEVEAFCVRLARFRGAAGEKPKPKKAKPKPKKKGN